jgi:UDP-N-acetylglucosamine 2-epimerase (non-hydrolysing)
VLRGVRPTLVVVQGDTTTALAAALAAFYEKIPVAHVEAGLRTGRRWSPFPEEMNRKLVTRLACVHYAPTARARQNLLDEGVGSQAIVVTGNPVLDALLLVARREFDLAGHLERLGSPVGERPLILLTAHRRESFGEPMRAAFEAVGELCERFPDHAVVYPVHPNPSVRKLAWRVLGRRPGVHLIPPLDYVPFVHLMKRARIILTDSGGIQEEAPSLGKPVLVLRENTERPEATEAGTALLVGHDPARIVAEAERLLTDPEAYHRMVGRENPFGDGHAAGRIVEHLRRLIA